MKLYRATCTTCPWTGTYPSQARANHALKVHSCARQQKLADTHARGEAQRSRIDRTPQPCRHNHGNHQHGSYVTYKLDGCRCLPCVAAVSAYNRSRERKIAYGTWRPLVDAEPARQHVRNLMAGGMGWKRIAKQAGISPTTVSTLLYGRGGRPISKRLRPDVAEALLSVPLAIAAGQNIDATGTWRRIHALIAIGYSRAYISQRLGKNGRALQLRGTNVTLASAQAIDQLYRELRDNPGPSRRARNEATRRGWLHPGWWDDDTIDDPTYTPRRQDTPRGLIVDQIAVDNLIAGRPGHATIAERREAVRHLHALGLSDGDIAVRL